MNTTKMTPRKIKAIETKKRIYHTALDLFIKRGYDNVTVDEIVEYSNTSKGAFYNHFKSKNEILIEQFKNIDDYYLQVSRDFPKSFSASKKLLEFSKAIGNYMETLGIDTVKVIYYSQIKFSDRDEPFGINKNRAIYKILQALIEEGQNSNEITRILSAEYIAEMFACCVRGTCYDWCLYNGKFNLSEALPKFFSTIFLNGILTEKLSS